MDAESFYRRGSGLIENGEYEKAVKCFDKALDLNPGYVDAWFELGNALKNLGKYQESNESYEKFVKTVQKNKFSEHDRKARIVSEYLNWVKTKGKTITFDPKDEPQYWLWVSKPEYFLEENKTEREDLEPGSFDDPGGWWTCHKDTNAGDLILFYRAGKEKGEVYQDIKYLLMARSDAYPLNSLETAGETNWKYGCDYIPLYKFEIPLKIKEMRDDPHLEEWNALRAGFQRQVFKTQDSIWKHLNDILSTKNPDYEKFLRSLDRGKIMAEILDEQTVENELADNFHIMEDFDYNLELISRQEVCTGDGGKMDILSKDKNTNEYIVIELKVVRANRCTFGQIASYMGWVKNNKANGDRVKGIVISRGCDKNFQSAMHTNSNIKHIPLKEILNKLGMKLK